MFLLFSYFLCLSLCLSPCLLFLPLPLSFIFPPFTLLSSPFAICSFPFDFESMQSQPNYAIIVPSQPLGNRLSASPTWLSLPFAKPLQPSEQRMGMKTGLICVSLQSSFVGGRLICVYFDNFFHVVGGKILLFYAELKVRFV